jgi:hypothetical protein
MPDANATARDHTVVDRLAVTDTLYRYASCIDSFDMDGLRRTLHDDLVARWGNADPVRGGDAALRWIREMTANVVWQHHLLSVYHVDIDGDRAKALVYHTSYQCFSDSPTEARQLVARYHNELRRVESEWRISELVMEMLWGEVRRDAESYLDAVGGRGPVVWRGPGES